MKVIKAIAMLLILMFSMIACNVTEGLTTTQKVIDVLMQILPIIAGVIAGVLGDEAVRKFKNKEKK